MYRTPRLEEFVKGFEFEAYVNKCWMPMVFNGQFDEKTLRKGIEWGKEIFRTMVIRVKAC